MSYSLSVPSLFLSLALSFSFHAAVPGASLGNMPAFIPALPVATSGIAAPTASTTSTASTTAGSTATTVTGSAADTATALAWVLNSLTGTSQTGTSLGERVVVGPGLPTVPKALLEKIQRWEYVDMADLLPAQNSHDAFANSPARFPLFSMEFVRPKRRQISSVVEWVQAFTVYTAAITQKHPSAIIELLACQLTIIKAA